MSRFLAMGMLASIAVACITAALAATPLAPAPILADSSARPGWGSVAYIQSGCDYFIIADSTGSYSLVEWYAGLAPSTGDRLYGEFQRSGFQTLTYGSGSSGSGLTVRVYVDDYWLSHAIVIERYVGRCQPVASSFNDWIAFGAWG